MDERAKRPYLSVTSLAALAWVVLIGLAPVASAVQEEDLTDRPISAIRIDGLVRVSEQLVQNQIRSAVGDPFSWETVNGDVRLLTRLGEFRTVQATAELLPDGTVALIYSLVESPIITEVQVIGNKVISDQDLLAVARLARGFPRDDFLIENAKRSMEQLYRERGHYLATVTVDESELEQTGILFFRVIEGPRVKVKSIEFEGNVAYGDAQLHAEIKSRTAVLFFRRGELDQDRLIDDISALDRFYKDRGYLDVRVGRTVELSPDTKEAKVTFLIEEGPQYTVGAIRTDPDPPGVLTREQLATLIPIKPGDVYNMNKIRETETAVRFIYGQMGYVDCDVSAWGSRRGRGAPVDLILQIDEGRRYNVGLVEIKGNILTQDRVILREFGLRPGRPFDSRELERSIQRLRNTRLFNDVQVTIRDPDPAFPEYRDVLIQVKEANTGSINFGAAAGSDTGIFGEFSLVQRNFDITDFPESFSELLRGRAFRGGGQQFSAVFRPGDELFQYSMSWTEPHLFDTDNSLRVSGSYRQREYSSNGRRIYDEKRLTLPSLGIGRRLGEFWDASLNARFERVELSDIAADAPADAFEAAGPDSIAGIGISLARSTVKTITRPGEGSRLELSFEQVGALGGDLNYSMVSGEYTVFLTMYRDFLGRASTLRLSTRAGYIFGGDAPLYERFYLGGRSLRGFEFRTVSPKGLDLMGNQTDDPVGGDWLYFAGAQYEIPLIGEALTAVVFVDSGTVIDDPGFDEYRVSVGGGIRLYIPQFGPIPIALDFATPILKQDGDETQLLSFSAELPF